MKTTNRLFSFIALILMVSSVNAANVDELLIADQAGDVEAAYSLGRIYNNSKGEHWDNKKSRIWFQKAGEQGHLEAQKSLATMYELGLGGTKDYNKAEEWYRKAAEQGDEKAQFKLGYIHSNTKKGIKNVKESIVWYRKSAEQGNVTAQINLALQYLKINDQKQAAEWAQKAAKNNNATAQYYLGLLYQNGVGLPKAPKEAYLWYYIAKKNGFQVEPVEKAIAAVSTSIMPAGSSPTSATSVTNTVELKKIKQKANICMKSGYTQCNAE